MKTTTIASHYVRAAIAGALKKGYSAGELLEQAGIGMELLSEPKARVYPDQMAKLLRVLVTELNDEFLGQDDKPSRRGTFEYLCRLVINSPSLGDALSHGTRYYGLFDMAMHTQYERSEEGGALVVNERRECLNQDHYLTEYQLVLWHRLACWLTGKRIPIDVAEQPPQHGGKSRTAFAHVLPAILQLLVGYSPAINRLLVGRNARPGLLRRRLLQHLVNN